MTGPLLQFHATSDVEPTPAPTPARPVGRPTMTSSRCRRCGRWLTLDDDEMETVWELASPGVICWNCDEEERYRSTPPDTR